MRKILLFKALIVVFTISLFSENALAQITTSSMSGLVQDAKGEILPGATVKATHTPSGTTYGVVTRTDGKFVISNMRVGGPYTITVSFIGYKSYTENGINTRLGEQAYLNIILNDESSALKEVVVTGRKNDLLGSNRLGAVTNLNKGLINSLPSISRSINDFSRLTPQANGTSIGGGNYRQNNITIDGADFNNNFGIGSNLPGGSSTPISLDAIEEISVNVTPYDVRQSGFIGSATNAVTRSGTNQFSGSAYTYLRNENFSGNIVGKDTLKRSNLDYKQYGFRFGGPLIKNKLFFFVNGEIENQITPGPQNVAATPEKPFATANANVSRPTVDELNNISNYLLAKYGYVTGPYQGYNSESSSQKFLARVDWNINKNHKLNARYSMLTSESARIQPSTSFSPFTNLYSQNRQSNQALQFENSGYFQGANFNSFASELNSNFGSKISNTLRYTNTFQEDPRTTRGAQFPFVDILKAGNPLTSFGTELFSFGNLRYVKTNSIVDELNINLGKHNIVLGGQADFSTTKNGFQRFGTGFYVFNSWDDFVNGAKPAHYGITYPLNSTFTQEFPSFKFAQYSLFAQDNFDLSNKLKLSVGLRMDYATYPSDQKTHPLIANLTFANNLKVDTGKLPDAQMLFSPRVGFNYDVKGDRSLILRGGSGIFTGRVPFVWVVSQIGDAGMLQATQTYSGASVPGPFRLEPYYPTTPATPGSSIPTGGTTIIDPNFKMPQTWKSSLAADFKLPGGIVASVEGIFNKDLNTAYFRNINLKDPAALNIAGYPDTRLMHGTTVPTRFINPLTSAGQYSPTGTQAYNVTQLGNSNKGYYWSANIKLEKQFTKGISAMASYIMNDAQNLFDGNGDQPASAFQGTPTVNGSNFPTMASANYVVPQRVIAALTLRQEYFKNLATSVSLFFEGQAQGRTSYVYTTDFNRDGVNSDLIYVPKDPSEITFVANTVTINGVSKTFSADEQSAAFFKYIDNDKYLKTRKGQYAERNGVLLPWRNQMDVKFMQDIFYNKKNKHTLQLSFDVFNFANLLNKKWGTVDQLNLTGSGGIPLLANTNNTSVVTGGTVKPTYRLTLDRNALPETAFRTASSFSSTYYMQVGLRYIFN
jgi:hypothetical protein